MASLSITTSIPPPWLTSKSTHHSRRIPSASLILRTGRSSVSVNVAGNNSLSSRSGLLHCSFVSSSFCSSAFHSAFSGLSLGLDFNSNVGVRKEKRQGLVVRAGKAALCQTKRNRSRKSLARTHGFRRRMRTTSGRAILKRRRAKGRPRPSRGSKHVSTEKPPFRWKYHAVRREIAFSVVLQSRRRLWFATDNFISFSRKLKPGHLVLYGLVECRSFQADSWMAFQCYAED